MDKQDILLKKKNDLQKLKKKKNLPSILDNIIGIASYLGLEEELRWANFEISGYPDPNDKIRHQEPIKYPQYRRITSHPIIKRQGIKDSYNSMTSGYWMCAPIKAIINIKKRDEKIKFIDSRGNQVETIIFYHQITKLIDGVKSKIREFYAKITEDRILSKKPLPDNQKFINADFKDYQLSEYNEFINLINDAAYNGVYYRILPILLRTLFENLLYDIFLTGLNEKHTDFFFLKSQNRAQDFSKLIALMNVLKDREFKPFHKDSINQKIIEVMKEIQKFGNWTVHQIFNQTGKEFADRWKDKINRVLTPLLALYKKIKDKAIEIEDPNTIDIINKTLNLRKDSDLVQPILGSEGLEEKGITQEKSELIESELIYNSQKIKLVQKFKNLYNRLASKNPEHVIIDIKTIVEDIGKIEVGKILRMEYVTEQDERIMLIEPKEWNLSIRTSSHRHLRLQKYINGSSQTYDFEFLNQNEEILNEFLKLIKDRCKEQGIKV